MFFEFSDHLELISHVFNEKRKNYSFSLREFSKNSGLDHTVLSRVIKKDRKLPLHYIEPISIALDLTKPQKHFLSLLVEYDHVVSDKAKELLLSEIKGLRTQYVKPMLSKEQFELTLDFSTLYIYEAISISEDINFVFSLKDHLSITKNDVQASLDQLVKAEMIEKTELGFKKREGDFNVKLNTKDEILHRFFRQFLYHAEQVLETQDPTKRTYRTRIMPIPRKYGPEISRHIDAFLGKLHNITAQYEEAPDTVACLNINFFKLDESLNIQDKA